MTEQKPEVIKIPLKVSDNPYIFKYGDCGLIFTKDIKIVEFVQQFSEVNVQDKKEDGFKND